MRLLTFLVAGERRLGALVGDRVVDLAAAQATRQWLTAVQSRICGH